MRTRKAVNSAVKTYFQHTASASGFELKLPPNLIREVEALAPSVMLNLHCMNYKDLRRAFKGNEKIIEETLKRYETRYTTKVNRAIYRLMVIALRAELQNILYTLTSSKLDDALAAVREVTSKYLNIAPDLHEALKSRRLNKVNLRKEFFKVPIDELERLVEQIDPTAEFNRTMQAEQYYQSLSL